MSKYLAIFLTIHLTFFTTARTEQADFSTFTIEQIAKHLGLQGGNWEVSLTEPCFLAFVVTKTSSDGDASREVYWSRTPSQEHRFFLSHHVTPGSGEQKHSLRYSSKQIEENGSSSGSGMSQDYYLPETGMQYFATETLKVSQDEPTTLYSWTNDANKREFRLEILFSTKKEEN